MRINFSYFPRYLQKRVINHPIAVIFCLLTIVYMSAACLIVHYEKVPFAKAATMLLPAFLGEIGEVESKSFITQGSVLVALLISVAFLAVITAKITTVFIEFCRRGGSVLKKTNLSNHIIICGWNFQGEKIVKELLESGAQPHREIVILANSDQRPLEDERVVFIQGDPTQDEDLIRAGVKNADSVIVLNDLTKSANEADAEALMIVLAVESINRKVHSCVQIVNSSNRRHLERAHADEIICLDQVGGNLVTASAINHGISRVVTELLTFNSGSEFYRYDQQLSNDMVGKEFFEVAQMLVQQHIILLGFETDDSEEIRQKLSKDVLHSVENGTRVIIVNPQSSYKIRQGDSLFIISESEPARL